MAFKMKLITVISFLATVICAVIYIATSNGVIFSLAITFGTVFYHFCMRLIVGLSLNKILNNRVDYNKKWFKVSHKEQKLYDKLNVKGWKKFLPTYNADLFNPQNHTWHEIAQAMCQAELVHEIIILLSFLPIVSTIWFGALPVFIITSVLSACFDSLFVILQRYNRPRVIKLIKKF